MDCKPTRWSIAKAQIGLLVLLASCCAPPAEPTQRKPTFEQLVVSIKRGMSVAQVEDVLGTATSTESSADGRKEMLWSEKVMGFHVDDPRLSGFKTFTVKVTFQEDVVSSVSMEYRLFH